jgi:acetyl esterase/lipase
MALLAVVVAIIFRIWIGELDFASFLIAKGSKLIIRGVYPKLDDDIASVRQMMNVTSNMPDQMMSSVVYFEKMRIFVPYTFNEQNKNTKEYLPVIIWIHGGGFVLGEFNYINIQCVSKY